MNYYNPFLSSWLDDQAGQTLAMDSALAAGSLMDMLRASTAYLLSFAFRIALT
jgi:hypothetical protein